ncbi:MAG TPA: tyrosine-type recombinase/integrase [Rugosibacter sp.]
MADKQIGDFLRTLDNTCRINEETRIAMLLAFLTVCRKVEVIEGRWDEVDMKGTQWETRATRMKPKRAHWVPLPPQAVALLTCLRALVPADREYLFPNRVALCRPMANRSLNVLMERLGLSGVGKHAWHAGIVQYLF